MAKTEHFAGKSALSHVIQRQIEGALAFGENHASGIPGAYFAFLETLKEAAVFTLGLIFICTFFNLVPTTALLAWTLFFMLWKFGRVASVGWSRLERLHRTMEEEKWEIENHRPQEREELKALYQAKGFEGKLLDDVVDVLMADGDRLLRVMLAEELGMPLGAYEHPIKEGLGAAVGALLGTGIIILGYFYLSLEWQLVLASLVVGLTAALAAKKEGNALLPALVWNVGLASVSLGSLYFLLLY